MNKYKLSQDVTCAGCAAKLNQKSLENILKNQNFYQSKNTIIGASDFDDAGVYQLDNGDFIVQSTDFFPPIVDDPFQFGQIATANALSDIYVMGATPITALNICCFPGKKYPNEVYSMILEGSAERLKAAKCSLLGGHTIEDAELKFGVAATGIITTGNLITNNNAKPGDSLFLTKPLGTGIITTAIKADMCPEDTKTQAIESMITLNAEACNIMINASIKSATDITGFGLIGHASEMCRASNVRMRIYLEKIPVFDKVFDLLNMGLLPAGSYKNKENNLKYVNLINDHNSDILFDAQTSGGVLMSVPPDKINQIENAMIGRKIGEVLENTGNLKFIEVI